MTQPLPHIEIPCLDDECGACPGPPCECDCHADEWCEGQAACPAGPCPHPRGPGCAP